MKNTLKVTLLMLTASLLAGCSGLGSVFGTAPSAPTAIERSIFTVQTNYVDVPVHVTNYVSQVSIQTNIANQVITITNNVTQVATVTNIVPVYVQTTSDGTKSVISAGGAALNVVAPGVGSMVSMGLIALLGLWGHLRSYKNGNAASALAQEVESMREFIKTLPNGTRYDTSITSWLQSHQMETGTAATVLGLVANSIDNPAAKVAAQEIIDTIKAANTSTAAPAI